MFSELLESIAKANIWAVLGGILLLVITSNALSTLIQKLAENIASGKVFKREVRAEALEAVGLAYAEYQRVAGADKSDADNLASGDFQLVTTQTALHVAVAKTGQKNLMALARTFTDKGETYATGDPDTNVTELDKAFEDLIDAIVKGTPSG